MDIEKAKSAGLFGRKFYIGEFFMEKDRSDFKTDEEFEKARAAAERNEFIIAREPTNEEVRMFSGADASYYQEAPEALKLERYKEYESAKKSFSSDSERVALSCITGSSFKDGDKPAAIEAVRELVKSRAPLFNKYLRDWMATLVAFENKSVKS